MALGLRKTGVTANADRFLRGHLEPEERIETVLFANRRAGGQADLFSSGYIVCLTDRRLFALRCRYLTGIPVRIAWSELRANVQVQDVGRALNTSLDLRRRSDGETLELLVGRPYNDEAAKIEAALEAAEPAEAGRDSS
jgi:hypothetical protein